MPYWRYGSFKVTWTGVFKKNVDKTLVYIQTLIETKLTNDLEVIMTSFAHIMYEDKIDYTTQNF